MFRLSARIVSQKPLMGKFFTALIQMDSSHIGEIHDRVVNSVAVSDAVAQAG